MNEMTTLAEGLRFGDQYLVCCEFVWTLAGIPPNGRCPVCTYWLKSQCHFGARCKNAHPLLLPDSPLPPVGGDVVRCWNLSRPPQLGAPHRSSDPPTEIATPRGLPLSCGLAVFEKVSRYLLNTFAMCILTLSSLLLLLSFLRSSGFCVGRSRGTKESFF